MDWNGWIGKKVFIRTLHGKVYSGIVKNIDKESLPIIWMIIIDKFGDIVQFSVNEIIEIKEERKK